MAEGETRAWELLASSDPRDVCDRAEATHSVGEGYTLLVFGSPVIVDPAARTIAGSSPESELVLTNAAHFSRLSILHYLLGARPLEPTGRLVSPLELKSGQFFREGSHRLPLDQIAARFCADPDGFVRVATRFGGRQRAYGDAAMELSPFPRVPVTLVFWHEDEEFPARTYLLFDDTCEHHLPADILWSVAMVCALVMLRG
jgi:Domain of unknown function (DUF3786)